MRENDKERDELKASRPKTLLMEKIMITMFTWALTTTQSEAKYQNNQKQ